MPLLCCLPRKSSRPATPGVRKKEYRSRNRVTIKDRYNLCASEERGQAIAMLDSHQLYPVDRRYQAHKRNPYTGYSTVDDFRLDGITSYSEDSMSSDSYPYPCRRDDKRKWPSFSGPAGNRQEKGRMGQLPNSSNFSRTDNSYSDPSTYSTYSDECSSAYSMKIITVTLNLLEVSYLGMSLVGQDFSNGKCGIYVGDILKGGAVDRDGRVETGDMILAVNDRSLEGMGNETAVNVLRAVVQQSSTVKLVVAKCWEVEEPIVESDNRFRDPVRPIDPSLWVAHTNAMTRRNSLRSRTSRRHHGSLATLSSLTSSSLSSSCMESETGSPGARLYQGRPLTIETPPNIIIDFMLMNDSGLELREKEWLKIRLPVSCLGSDLIDWLLSHVHGFIDRRDVKKYARALLKACYIRSALKDNQKSFSEDEYYTFPQILEDAMSAMSVSGDNTDSEAYFPSKSKPAQKADTHKPDTQPILHQPPVETLQQKAVNNLKQTASSQPSIKKQYVSQPPAASGQTAPAQNQKDPNGVTKPASQSSSSSGFCSQKTNSKKPTSSKGQSMTKDENYHHERSQPPGNDVKISQNPNLVTNARNLDNAGMLPLPVTSSNTHHPQTTDRPPAVIARPMNRYSQSVATLNQSFNQPSTAVSNQCSFTASQPNLLNAPHYDSSQTSIGLPQSSSTVLNARSMSSAHGSTPASVQPSTQWLTTLVENRPREQPLQYQRQTKHSDV